MVSTDKQRTAGERRQVDACKEFLPPRIFLLMMLSQFSIMLMKFDLDFKMGSATKRRNLDII